MGPPGAESAEALRARDVRPPRGLALEVAAAESTAVAWRASACCSIADGPGEVPARTTRTVPPSSTIIATNVSAFCSEGVGMAAKMRPLLNRAASFDCAPIRFGYGSW